MSYAASSAHRAATIATIARTRAASPAPIPNAEGRAALMKIADLLDAAADAFRSSTPAVIDGITMNEIPADAWFALADAEDIAVNTPAAGFPVTLGQYVTRRQDIDLPPSLLPGGLVLIAKEGDLFARLLALHGHLTVTTTEESTAAALEAAFALHWKHARLAESEAVMTDRPANRPAVPAAVEIPTPGTPMALSRAHDAYGPTVTYGLTSRHLPCHVSDQGATHTAVRMVSHLGATIAACDDDSHRNAAAVAARELYDSLG
ncbi:hypothetical protein [Streptomyces pseudovenezuelae]|uniref:hypothetical protein n=1 Tax=Streptomyces pseudovenezuelae TaxID=67350 RepID=UPI0036EFFBC4